MPPPLERTYAPEWVETTARQNGLDRMGVRPSLREYIPELWKRRTFIRVLAISKAQAKNQNTYLGQVWALLTPILNAFVYILIFGFILQVGRAGIENTIAFIVVGVFMFRFFEMSLTAGSKAIRTNMNLVRSVHFPRAVLPIAGVAAELTTLAPALVVMCVIAYFSGLLPNEGAVPLAWRWLLLVPAVLLLWCFCTGVSFIMARVVAQTPDIDNLIPFGARILMYASGVIFSIDHFVGKFSWGWVMEYQPVAVYLSLARSSILNEPAYPLDPVMWLVGLGWAAVFLVGGFLYFWQGEETYGRN
ncbi:ABC transporter [Brachybacterium endophyticum]|uniref:Transport permease protein n=1 Tax=Brachybacterium endophyticum TaxID=2182385 RepID=A0A2U2RKW7_9MICO|nr:ABC transporter permease [Brachybacterium endophyticum]PWH06481.1 ABC transporter [Brachybacterium endophyticum]